MKFVERDTFGERSWHAAREAVLDLRDASREDQVRLARVMLVTVVALYVTWNVYQAVRHRGLKRSYRH